MFIVLSMILTEELIWITCLRENGVNKTSTRVMIKAIDRKLRDRRLMRNLEKFVGGRPYGSECWKGTLTVICCDNLSEHQSDTQVITVKMEILLEPTSNKLMVGDLCDSIRIKLVTTGKKRCDEVLKLNNFKNDASLKLFKLTNQERYENVGPKVTSSQDGKVYKMAKRDYAWLMISRCSRSLIHIQVKLKEQAQA
ncbi:hypothetical protein Tco_0411337 [Tanacetum coccineum]